MMWLKSIKALSLVASISLVSAALFIAYIVLFPVDVITNWKLSIPKTEYTLGETVVIESLYTKKINTPRDSQSERYLECKNANGIYIRYLLNKAAANRAASPSTGTGVVVTIPDKLAELNLPTSCFFSIAINYNVYPRRAEAEYNRTQNFTLIPKSTENTEGNSQPRILPESTQQSMSVELEDTKESEMTEGTQSSDPTPITQQIAPQPQQPSFFQRLLNLVGIGALI